MPPHTYKLRARLLALVLVFTVGAWSESNASVGQAVHTTSGDVIGLPPDAVGIRAYLGIPYAEAPTGSRRFLPPKPISVSHPLLRAVQFGPASAQRPEGEDEKEFGGFLNEDSLTLNIWSPAITGKRPVMVWIHGGGNTQGASREVEYNGSRLAARGDVVVVSLNYRLGIFGFVDVSVLGGAPYRQSANNGLLDQLMALRWVKQNIERFGGDPDNVTVFGNSAGAADISALLAVDAPDRYFHRAIIQSGFANTTKSKEVAQRFSGSMFARAHIGSMRELLAKSTRELLAVQAAALKDLSEMDSDLSFQPTVDGELIKEFPIQALQRGNAKKIDLILGTTENEARLYLKYNPELRGATLTDLPGVRGLSATQRETLGKLYRRTRMQMTDGQVSLDIAGDYWFRAGAIRMAEAQIPYNPNVYLYLFAWQSADSELGAPHAIELPFVFGNEKGQSPLLGNLDDRQTRAPVEALSSVVQQYWTSFARDGRPSAGHEVEWPRYDLHSRFTMVFDRRVAVVADPKGNERAAFNGLDLDRRLN